jgi:hypothetical protein
VLLLGRSFTTPDSNTRITIQPRTLDFGNVQQGSTNEQSFTIFNSDTTTGAADTNRRLTGTIGTPGNAAFVITNGGGAFSLRRGESRVVTVRFMPVTGQQSYADSIRITSNAANDSLGFSSVRLLGRVQADSTSADSLFVDRTNINFGTVQNGTTRTESFTISNQDTSSTSRPIVGTIGSPTGTAFTIISGGGAFTLSRGESRVVTVQYGPTGNQATTDTGTIRIRSNAGDSTTGRIIRLQGQSSNPVSSVSEESSVAGLLLRRNYPNPFDRTTTVEFVLPRTMHVELGLYNTQGVQVASIVDMAFPAGEHRVTVDAESLAGGVYFLQMRAGDTIRTVQVTVAK